MVIEIPPEQWELELFPVQEKIQNQQEEVQEQVVKTLTQPPPTFTLKQKDFEVQDGKITSLFFTYNPPNHPPRLYKITLWHYTIRRIEDQKQRSIWEDEYSYIKLMNVNTPRNIVIQEYSSRKRSKWRWMYFEHFRVPFHKESFLQKLELTLLEYHQSE